jgi:dihydrofolate reductase
MASEVIAYVAVSLDGYIAREDGTSDFLATFGSEEFGFHEFFATIGGVVLGGTTYRRISGRPWPYGAIPGLVLTSRDPEPSGEAELAFSDAPTGDAIRRFAEGVEQRVWVVGGGRVVTDGINQGAIDVLEIHLMPVALGSGVPLFPGPVDVPLDLVASKAYSNSVVRLVYRPRHG